MAELYLPTLHYFENGNRFSGSDGPLRFMLTPDVVMLTPKEVNLAGSSIRAQLWHGPYCLEKSEVEQERVFPMSEEALGELRQWLLDNRSAPSN